MAALTRVWFIRHGEVDAPFVGTFLGSTDVPLSEVGKHQGEAIAHFLEPMELDAVLTSPLRRARETGMATAKSLGVEPLTQDWAKEMHFGTWEARSWDDIVSQDPAFAQTWQENPGETPCPDGDTANDYCASVQQGLAETLDEFRGRAVALFAHAGTNRAILSHITGRPYMESFVFAQDYGCVNAAAWDGSGAGQLALMNAVPGPKSESNGDGGRAVEEAQ